MKSIKKNAGKQTRLSKQKSLEVYRLLNTANAKGALASMNLLFTLCDCVIQKDHCNPIYKVNAINAYEQKLVKHL
jgi:restriction endonuclease